MGLIAALAFTACAHAQDAALLQDRYAALQARLASGQWQRPLVIDSTQADGVLDGDVHAVVAQPYELVAEALHGARHWCDLLVLHMNVKSCRVSGPGFGTTLSVLLGSKLEQPLASTYRIDFTYQVAALQPAYLRVLLNADAGPMDTANYRVMFEAVPLDAKTSFVHMSYSYAYGFVAGLAMDTYLATIGREKVGFSIVGPASGGTPAYVGGVRGVIERTTMRYYLAIETYLATYRLPEAQQFERRLQDWFTASERYPRQLHEMERDEYVAMKHRQLAQQQVDAPRPN